MTAVLAAAWGVAAVLTVLGLLHLYWAATGASAGGAVIPERDGRPVMSPGPLVTMVVALALFAAAALVLLRGGAVPAAALPPALVRWGAWGVAAAFLGRAVGEFRYVGFFKRVRGTRFARWDTLLFSPLCAAIGATTALIASR